jgi:DNA-binding response OmpR family regulator
MNQERILLALEPAAFPEMRRALAAYELLEAANLTQAQNYLLDPRIDMFVVGIHFDDSRAMELIRIIRSNKRLKSVPVLVIRTLPSEQAKLLRDALGMMKVVMAISDYMELEGDAQAAAKVAEAVAAALFRRAAKRSRI